MVKTVAHPRHVHEDEFYEAAVKCRDRNVVRVPLDLSGDAPEPGLGVCHVLECGELLFGLGQYELLWCPVVNTINIF